MSRKLALRVKIGKCPDYHTHVQSDGHNAGIAATLWPGGIHEDRYWKEGVYAESHGRADKALPIETLGRKPIELLVKETTELLSKYPPEFVRTPSFESGKTHYLGSLERFH